MKPMTILSGLWRIASRFIPATKHDASQIKNMSAKILAAIAAFATAQNAHNAAIETAIDNVAGDIGVLNAEITKLKEEVGDDLSPEAQAILDGLLAKSATIVANVQALDALTPPVVPPTTEPEPPGGSGDTQPPEKHTEPS